MNFIFLLNISQICFFSIIVKTNGLNQQPKLRERSVLNVESDCEQMFKGYTDCILRCEMGELGLIDEDGELQPDGLNFYFPTLTRRIKMAILRDCFHIKGISCKKAVDLLICCVNSFNELSPLEHNLERAKMSSHSRSSSEIEKPSLSDILQVYYEAFVRDFDFYDVKDDVKIIFSKEEYQMILDTVNPEEQIALLFWILCTNKGRIQNFLDYIRPDYNFLTVGVMNELENPTKQTKLYIDNINRTHSNAPKFTNYNVIRKDKYIELRKALLSFNNNKPYHCVVLEGELGVGKKWLTLHVCNDFSVLRAMDFKIYWIDVSNCTSPEEHVNCLQKLRLLLGGSSQSISPTFSSISNNNYNTANRKLHLQQCLRNKFTTDEFKNCLVILNGLQDFETFETFNLGCKLLLIKRNKKDLFTKDMTKYVRIKSGLNESEFFTLMERYLDKPRSEFPKSAIKIYRYSNGHPYILSVIAQNLQQNKSNWDYWIKSLESHDISAKEFNKVVEVSLNVLSPEYLNLYAIFSVFRHSIPIPVELLASLWNKDRYDAMETVDYFDKYSFINKEALLPNEDINSYSCTIQFLYSSYLKKSEKLMARVNTKEVHNKIIKYYKVEEIFKHRIEYECTSQHDWYFFNFIGYHLNEAARDDLFPLLYLDFGFLEQKMRVSGLSSTIEDLNKYEKKIIQYEPRNQDLISSLLEFLPITEEKLTESRDTSLLQYALLADGRVCEEAKVQILKFKNRVWFKEHGNFHKRRQIVQLSHEAKLIHLLNQELCVVVLENDDMLLLDTGLYSNTRLILLDNGGKKRKNNEIVEVRLFRDNKFIITLDAGGSLKIWSIATEIHNYDFQLRQKDESRKYKQRIQEDARGNLGVIVAFFIEQLSKKYNNETYLHVAFKNGEISVFKWDPTCEEFKSAKFEILKTRNEDIRFLCKILRKFYIVISKSGEITYWNLNDTSKPDVVHPKEDKFSVPISYELYTFCKDNTMYTHIIFVFTKGVLGLKFKHKDYTTKPDYKETFKYKSLDSKNRSIELTCAKLSNNERFLVLGTNRGIIVYDICLNSEVLRSNVSETITFLDIYPLDDLVYKYIIISTAKGRKFLTIYAIRSNGEHGIAWGHNVTTMGNIMSSDPQLEHGCCFLGQKLFDTYYKDDGSTRLVAVDSKNNVHKAEKKSWSLLPTKSDEEITSITTGKELTFIGYKNGKIFNITKGEFEKHCTGDPIIYLELLDNGQLVASTETKTIIRNVEENSIYSIIEGRGTKKCYKIFQKYILLIDPNGQVGIFDQQRNEIGSKSFDFYDSKFTSCDFQNNCLCLSSSKFVIIYRCKFDARTNGIQYEKIHKIKTQPNLDMKITCTALAKDSSLLAVGCLNGEIEIYNLQEDYKDPIYHLESHRGRINDMKFSPGNEVLVSCGDILCFWSILYLINNQYPKTTKRNSSRYTTKRRSDHEEVDAQRIEPSNGYLKVNDYNENLDSNGVLTDAINNLKIQNTSTAWRDKAGPAEKPELLACFKFDGKQAEKLCVNADFTQFNTIDDDGAYYNLKLIDTEQFNNISNGSGNINDNSIGNGNGNGNLNVNVNVNMNMNLNVITMENDIGPSIRDNPPGDNDIIE